MRAGLWRHRDFRLLWGGQTISQTGSQVTIVALPLVAIVLLRASAFQVGLLSAATTGGFLLISLPAGVLADRVSRRRLMLGCDLVMVAVIGSVPAAQTAGVLTLGQLYLVALVSSACGAVFLVAYTSYLPGLIDPGQLREGNAKLTTTQSAAQVAGPGLGALLVGLFGPALALIGDAGSFAASAVTLLLIRNPESRPPRPRQRLRAELGQGLGYVRREPVLRRGAAWSGTANFFVIMVETLGPVFLVRTVHLRPAYVGVLLALGAAGGVAGGLLSGSLTRRIGAARLSWLSTTVFTLPGLLIPLARPGWPVLLFAAGWVSWTFGATLCSILLVSYQQATCPPALRGRVSAALRWINWGTLPLGALAAGALSSRIGVHTVLWLAVIGGSLSGLWLLLSPVRRMPDLALTAQC
ncbi:MAG TPA: MFS transporter [Streptosporangiaceae bacterium]|jgi:MFS family permease|nr:MFS transporter [Streptosporangiaceae bacterium]